MSTHQNSTSDLFETFTFFAWQCRHASLPELADMTESTTWACGLLQASRSKPDGLLPATSASLHTLCYQPTRRLMIHVCSSYEKKYGQRIWLKIASMNFAQTLESVSCSYLDFVVQASTWTWTVGSILDDFETGFQSKTPMPIYFQINGKLFHRHENALHILTVPAWRQPSVPQLARH